MTRELTPIEVRIIEDATREFVLNAAAPSDAAAPTPIWEDILLLHERVAEVTATVFRTLPRSNVERLIATEGALTALFGAIIGRLTFRPRVSVETGA